ncbi:DegT/DnrJ/EryC1/StrS aminotransferase family protein [Litoricolaceae bacterium]|nr:DegT/DnrJ/EryC1/StrS aminotransferase family protein [Litorivicinaceae bacterium]
MTSSWPLFSEEELVAVSNVLKSGAVNYWTGNECEAFEKEFAQFSNAKFAVSLANGTVALEAALFALGIGAGDEVVVTSRTFLASASSIVSVGAIPVFADVDRDSQNITAETVMQVLSPRTRAIVCVHLAGWPCDMDPIMALACEHDLFVIEDCAQAHGARYKGRSVGSIGHVGAWSFCQDKIMSTGGEGGMVTCNDEVLWRSIWSYKDHGKSYMAVYEREHPPGFRWLHESFGTNGRMTEMQAAIGRIQLRRMKNWTRARTANAMAIREALVPFATLKGIVRLRNLGCSDCPLLGCSSCSCVHAYYKYYVFLCPENLVEGWSRDRIVEEINARGVPCYTGSCSEVYLEKAFDNTCFRPKERLPVAKELGETSLMFLVHPTLTDAEIKKTVQVIHEVLEKALISTKENFR